MAHGRAEMARAVLEGVALNLRLTLDVFGELGAVHRAAAYRWRRGRLNHEWPQARESLSSIYKGEQEGQRQ